MCLLQVFSLNLITFHLSFCDSIAVLFTTEFSDSLSDSGRYAGFSLGDIEQQEVDYG